MRTIANDLDVNAHGVVFDELHHRFYNSLQVISALINKVAKDARSLPQVQEKIANLAGLHRLLASPHLTAGSMRHACDQICLSLVQAFDRDDVSMAIHVKPVEITPEMAKSLCLLIAELVTNALKHSTGGAPSMIGVSLEQGRNGLELRVINDIATEVRASRPRVASAITASIGGTLEVYAQEWFEVLVTVPPMGEHPSQEPLILPLPN